MSGGAHPGHPAGRSDILDWPPKTSIDAGHVRSDTSQRAGQKLLGQRRPERQLSGSNLCSDASFSNSPVSSNRRSISPCFLPRVCTNASTCHSALLTTRALATKTVYAGDVTVRECVRPVQVAVSGGRAKCVIQHARTENGPCVARTCREVDPRFAFQCCTAPGTGWCLQASYARRREGSHPLFGIYYA